MSTDTLTATIDPAAITADDEWCNLQDLRSNILDLRAELAALGMGLEDRGRIILGLVNRAMALREFAINAGHREPEVVGATAGVGTAASGLGGRWLE